jgi:hypothetical protein
MPEYMEGPSAKKKFEQAIRTLFQAPKAENPTQKTTHAVFRPNLPAP